MATRISIVFTLLFLSFGCSTFNPRWGDNYVQNRTWQWDSGYKLGDGDFVDFCDECGYRVLNGVISSDGFIKGVCVKLDTNLNTLTIQHDKEEGVYIDIIEFTR